MMIQVLILQHDDVGPTNPGVQHDDAGPDTPGIHAGLDTPPFYLL